MPQYQDLLNKVHVLSYVEYDIRPSATEGARWRCFITLKKRRTFPLEKTGASVDALKEAELDDYEKESIIGTIGVYNTEGLLTPENKPSLRP